MTHPRSAQRVSADERRARRAAVGDPGVVMAAAGAFLAVRQRSVSEARGRLRRQGYREDLVEGVIDRLLALGYLDDEAFAQTWVESRDRARPRASATLRRELAAKGVAREMVERALAARGPAGEGAVPGPDPDRTAAALLLERRHATLQREPDERRRRQRAYSLLARNGFEPGVCRELAASVVGTLGSEPGDEFGD